MRKALTARNRKFQEYDDVPAQRLFGYKLNAHFPSYFGNIGIFNLFLMLRADARLSTRCLGKEQRFPLITAFMAIV
jgi:hypothetical protein